MAGWGVPCHWLQDDLLHWAGQPGERFSVISCLFGLHHLDDPDKQRFLERVGGRLAEGGLLLIGDVFREPGEDRQAYVQRYVRRIRQQWTSLGAGSAGSRGGSLDEQRRSGGARRLHRHG
jgi:hypothetical protein